MKPLVRNLLPLLCLSALVACNLPVAAPPIFGPTGTPFQPSLENDGVENGSAWWFAPGLPQGVLDHIDLPDEGRSVSQREEADIHITINEGQSIGYWVYALVAPFPTLLDEVSLAEVQNAWEGRAGGSLDGAPLMMASETQAALSALWGEPAEGAVELHEPQVLLDAAWEQRPSWAIVPFEELQPRWKVLAVNGQSPIWKDFDPTAYALSLPIGMLNASGAPLNIRVSNREAEKLTSVALTGVTALVRATADKMNREGVTYPAEEIGPLLREADITHISNEVAFWNECPPPNPVQPSLRFCSDPSYIQLLEAVGTDVVELSGDHFNDYGQEAMLYTLDLYDDHGIPYYGGGRDIGDAQQPLIIEHNGNRIAFFGCNAKAGYATASETLAGAVQCDYDWLAGQIEQLSEQGYLVIATFQHNEVYTFVPQPTLIRDFSIVADAGATIVSGSQAHQSHGMDFPTDHSFITYGLGNLFFDQRGVVDNGDRALIARHVFYDGRYLSTELFTIQFVDFAKPRFMTEEERTEFLQTLFDASLWNK